MKKICASCKFELPIGDFPMRAARGSKPPRPHSYCKKCNYARSAARRRNANRDKPKVSNPDTKGAKIRKLLLAGQSYGYICKELDVAASTVAYHVKALGLGKFSAEQKDYDWQAIQERYDAGTAISNICKQFGITITAFHRARDIDGNIRGTEKRLENSPKRTDSDVFREGSSYTAASVKRRILKKDLIAYRCSVQECVLHTSPLVWNGRNIVLHLDHINGVRNDHRLTNLRWLCPNCHSQTDTYCGRNNKA